jgi:RNase P/RNase MRP subunit p29
VRCDLNGVKVGVLSHTDPGLEGLEGKVIWEGEKTLLIEAKGKTRTVFKGSGFFVFVDDSRQFRRDGITLQSKVTNRIVRMRCKN